ncbi:MAG: glycosyl hydrolase [Verrucomicrobia bacterium]|nr:glycosyl hydrolase [Verrucomicrobiota bacterium]
MNGNVTKAGITADLEAMKRIGLGGAQIFSVALGAPAGMVKEVPYFSDEWRAMVQFSAEECSRLGLELSSLMGDGWSGGGGPWIKPDNAMQRVTWSETRVSGPGKFTGKLPQPATKLDTYRDIAVLAIPAAAKLPAAKKSAAKNFCQLEYDQPVTVRSVTVTKQEDEKLPHCLLQASDDGKVFRDVCEFDTGWRKKQSATYPSVTIGFEAVQGRFFKLVLSEMSIKPQDAKVDFTVDAEAHVSYWGLKAGFDQVRDHGGGAQLFAATGNAGLSAADSSITSQTVNLSSRMTSDGRLEWDVPQGEWTILRIGHTPTGQQNAPATEAGRGLECDKLSPHGIEAQFDGMMAKQLKRLGPLAGKTFTQAIIDSWEQHDLNWTPAFREEFQKRRGYDLMPWLPVMAGGHIVGDREHSERFLWDLRRTIADLIAENFWGRLTSLCHEHGIIFQGEPCGRQQYLYDPIVFQKQADIPMGEFWVGSGPRVDCRTAASAAHVYGKTIVGAEAFTSVKGNWADDPYSMKTLGDRAFCLGVNRFVFHRFAHQPWLNLKPGMSLSKFGINCGRTITWWEQGAAWISYITRSQYLLSQGRFVADVVHLTGEGAPNYLGWREELHPALPAGFDYDGCDADAVLRVFAVHDGRLVTPSGMSYRFLLLPDSELMTPAVARRIRELVRDGALVIGPRPTRAPGLSDFPNCDREVQTIGREVWGDCDGKTVKAHAFGKGRVYWGREFNELAAEIGLQPDFEYQLADGQAELLYIHRRTQAAEVYFVSNQSDAGLDALCTFRVTGKQPELWDAASGKIRDAARYEEKDGRTTVQIPFDPRGSWFVVFRKPASPLAVKPALPSPHNLWIENGKVMAETATATLPLDTDWNVTFQPERGAPPSAHLDRLMDLSRHPEEGIRHFSGTASYRKTIRLSSAQLQPGSLFLDLGAVHNLAEVIVNGHNLGVLWKQPFRADITGALQAGENEIEVRVTDLWVNRLIGDVTKMAQAGFKYHNSGALARWPEWVGKDAPPADAPVSFAIWQHYTKDSPLPPSGLLGPVTLQTVMKVATKP